MSGWTKRGGIRDSMFKILVLFIAILVFAVVVTPLISVCAQSFTYVGTDQHKTLTFHWYLDLFQSIGPAAWWNTLYVSGTVAILGAALGFMGALNWWSPRRMYLLLSSSFVISSLPAAAQAAALAYSFRLLGLHRSITALLVAAHAVWVIPFCTIIILASFSAISDSQIGAALELSKGRRTVVAKKVILPTVGPAIVSSALIAFLLSINEYVRTMYLSGSVDLLSRKINGMMMSGTDPTVYAITGLNIALALAGLGILSVGITFSRRHRPSL
jgi:spermidine/putrescine transport system permease protein